MNYILVIAVFIAAVIIWSHIKDSKDDKKAYDLCREEELAFLKAERAKPRYRAVVIRKDGHVHRTHAFEPEVRTCNNGFGWETETYDSLERVENFIEYSVFRDGYYKDDELGAFIPIANIAVIKAEVKPWSTF